MCLLYLLSKPFILIHKVISRNSVKKRKKAYPQHHTIPCRQKKVGISFDLSQDVSRKKVFSFFGNQ